MIIKTQKAIPSSEITDPHVFKQRREIIKALFASAVSGSPISSAFATEQLDRKNLLSEDAIANIGTPPYRPCQELYKLLRIHF
ncbi:hypothetical protein [Methylocucumis oryzae]|uniref:hypothetical protein n=1 Tax=Methylocucumis oryzae TaxID=1632867 RepID=UPI0010388233|nr:hypothetical protein [Methylocucumis oryzae]